MGPRSDNGVYGDPMRGMLARGAASMGPRSDNRGYGRIHVPLLAQSNASMGPRSDNRGYGVIHVHADATALLQWVHGRITVVMDKLGYGIPPWHLASMGP